MDFFKRLLHCLRGNFFVLGFLSLIWFALRTGSKPSRAVYPCQRVAASNSLLWLFTCCLGPLSIHQSKIGVKKWVTVVFILMAAFSLVSLGFYWTQVQPKNPDMKPSEGLLTTVSSSSIFVVNGTLGNDGGITRLIELMGQHDLLFYKSKTNGQTYGPAGLFSKDDVIVVKVNCQWDQRGGTNTDLLKALIQAILNHPDSFRGEIVVADNGQGRGSLDWSQSNAEDRSQSTQKVVDLFSRSSRVSGFLWDYIRSNHVQEYSSGDMSNGYVVSVTADPDTGIKTSYPKFKTVFGTYISFKMGVWDPSTKSYDDTKLKVINVPILKTHSTYGVTASVKNYMGVVSQPLTNAHSTVGQGGMGTEMVETRFPTLNVLDAIWVNVIPRSGPRTFYSDATQLNIIAASTDPVALDFWTSKNLLIPNARKNGYTDVSSMEPNNKVSGSFGDWLRLSMQAIRRAGYQAATDESKIFVHVASR